MKKILFGVMLFVVAILSAQETIQGQRKVQGGLVAWKNTVTGLTHTRLRFLPGTGWYMDTSIATVAGALPGQSGQWKRIDNGADSCSLPLFLSSDSNGLTAPIWKFELEGIVKTPNPAASTHIYRIQTRNAHVIGNVSSLKRLWRPWTRVGRNAGSTLSPIQDSIVFPHLTGGTANVKYAQRGIADLHGGTQFRLCPDDLTGTSATATDTLMIDSLIYEGR